jgi:hypothetical protein
MKKIDSDMIIKKGEAVYSGDGILDFVRIKSFPVCQ